LMWEVVCSLCWYWWNCWLSLFKLSFNNIRSKSCCELKKRYGLRGVMVFNATFNNISVISRQPVLLVEETGVPEENHWSVASHWQTWSYNVASNAPRHELGSNSQL
jgi:hypothetical protein